jgi:hypothetical protein
MFDSTGGPAREQLDRAEMDALRGTVVVDERRRRPFYFDGRFLAARDLIREQDYFLTRQADLGRAGGSGVVNGLMVERGDNYTLRIGRGHGVTPAGELVVLPRDLNVNLSDLPQIQRLDAAFGLMEIPREPARNRSGLYVVGLRPVEFTANPIASYPTSINGQRSVEFGEIVEGVAVTLVPYPDDGNGNTAEARRARVAYDTFVSRGTHGPAAPLLPLAMVLLNRGTVQWVDPYMVRREVGADHGDVLGLGFAPRALREAHLLQYDAHLNEVLALRRSAAQGERFAASDYFQALPPAGRLPAASLNPADFTQIFFPPTVDVDLSIVPEDELPALVEESLLLPPIDLTASAEALDGTSVLMLFPVSRSRFRQLAAQLGSVTRPTGSSVPFVLAGRRPLELLQGLRLPKVMVPVPTPQETADTQWRSLIPTSGMFWYVRRRNLQYKGDVTGVPVQVQTGMTQVFTENAPFGVKTFAGTQRMALSSEAGVDEAGLSVDAGQATDSEAKPKLSPDAPQPETVDADAGSALSAAPDESATAGPGDAASSKPADGDAPQPGPVDTSKSPGGTKRKPAAAAVGVVKEDSLHGLVLAAMDTLHSSGAELPLKPADARADPAIGAGLAKLDKAQPELKENPKLVQNLAKSGALPHLDAVAAQTPRAQLADLAAEVAKAGTGARAPARLNTLLTAKRQAGEP